ncbi:MAG: hypothetical protein GWO20_14015 [Candidatus Korarchaeota archaeon]|nr:hypothetical protein [Candidatus Korarchaeota archaeon]NIU84533.1 hypothetical protein [Candidatus Thorarchaeota archaeon]NIW14600.1 hypothetical protein [Candidatus Thorarchaeota archaeon]NIW52672.1 hypothetical protein [Candidatus Korarchaeota archaeon]
MSFTITDTLWVEAGENGKGVSEQQAAGNISFVLTSYNLTHRIVKVKPGTYDSTIERFPLNVTDFNVTLKAVGTPADTIIEGTEEDYCIKIMANNIEIKNFSIINGEYGIYVTWDVRNATVMDNFIHNHDGDGIYMSYGNNYTLITHNTITGNGGTGIYSNGYYTNITKNNITNNDLDGVEVFDPNQTIVHNNISYNKGDGITVYSSYNNLSCNLLTSNNWDGITIWGEDYEDNILTENIITGNELDGIELYESDRNIITENIISNSGYNGISLSSSTYNQLKENSIQHSDYDGLYLKRSSENTIKNNIILDNHDYGLVLIDSSKSNHIYRNDFVGNGLNVKDECGNAFNNSKVGNYWDTYLGKDANNDEIGDTPYLINETLGINDHLPSMTFFNIEDTTSPSVSITHPNGNANISSSEISVVWSGSDNTDVSYYEIRIDGGSWENIGEVISYDLTGLEEGIHSVNITAVDGGGNKASYSISFTIDTVMPSVSIDSPQDDAILNASSVTVTWSGSDPTPSSGIQTYSYQLDGNTWMNITATSHMFSDLTEGDHTVRIKVYDWARNEDVISVSFVVDTEDPTISIISPEDDATIEKDTVTVEWTGSDEGSGIDYYEVRLDSNSWETVDGTSYEFTDVSDGGHTVEVRAVDTSGKTSMASVSFTVNTSPIGGPGLLEEFAIVGAFVAIVAIVVALYFLKWKKG